MICRRNSARNAAEGEIGELIDALSWIGFSDLGFAHRRAQSGHKTALRHA